MSRRFINFCLGFIFLGLVADGSLWGEARADSLSKIFSSFESKIRYFKLDNGLRLILLRRGSAPVVSAYIKFKVGSYDEKEENFGLAHMLEHMLFKGTRIVGTRNFAREQKYLILRNRFALKLDHWRKRYDKQSDKNSAEAQNIIKEIAKQQDLLDILYTQSRNYVISEEDAFIYATQGARGYNAYTSSDLTNYQVNLPSTRLEVWARLESDRIKNAVLRDFYRERDVVQEERRMRIDNSPRSQLWEKFNKAIYTNHPYGHSVIGPMEKIKYLNYEQAQRFYREYYSPNNMVITLVGNFNLSSAEKMVRKYFGKLEARPLPTRVKATPPKRRRLEVSLEGGDAPLLYMAWLKPAMPNPNDLYLEILSSILAGRSDTRLHRRLINEENLAVSVFAQNGVKGNRAMNLFLIGIEPVPNLSPEKMQRIESIVLEELQKIHREGPKPEELSLSAKHQNLSIVNYFQKNAKLADLLGYFETIVGDYRQLFRYNMLLDTIKKEDVQRAAVLYLQPRYTMTARLKPRID